MNPTPADWTAKLPNLKRAGGQFEGPCPLCGGTDRFHVNLEPPHLFGCRQCEDGPAILRAVFGERQKRKPPEECIDAEYETADGLRHKAYRMDWPGDWGGQSCDWKDRGRLCTRSSPHKHLWEQKHKGLRGRPAGLNVAFWTPDEPKAELVSLIEGPKTARAVRDVGYVASTWCGGTSGVEKSDFSRLKGHDVVAWPDASRAGRKALAKAAHKAYDAGARSIRFVAREHFRGETDKDAADFTPDERRRIIEEARNLDEWIPPDATIESSRPPESSTLISPDAEGLRTILGQLKLEVRRNARNLGLEVRRIDWPSGAARWWRDQWEAKLPDGWVQWSDKIAADIRQFSKANYRFTDGGRMRRANWTDRDFMEALLYLTPTPDPDPFTLWLESLPKWDGTKRIARLWIDTLHIPETDLSQKAGRRFLIGAVRRAYEPGCIHDWMPVLVGPQGLGKSSILRALLPAPLWFSDGAQLDGSPKERYETTGPAVISEFAEMAGLERANAAKFKTYLTQRRDRFRPAYAKESVDLGRRWVGVGTANPDPAGVLPADPSGNRRYVVLESSVDEKDSHMTEKAAAARQWVLKNRAQLWAEALHEYREACKRGDGGMNLTGDMREAAEAAAFGWQRRNEGMADLVDGLLAYGQAHPKGCTIVQLMVKAGLSDSDADAAKDRRNQNLLARALVEADWAKSKRTVDRRRTWRWFPPPAGESHEGE